MDWIQFFFQPRNSLQLDFLRLQVHSCNKLGQISSIAQLPILCLNKQTWDGTTPSPYLYSRISLCQHNPFTYSCIRLCQTCVLMVDRHDDQTIHHFESFVRHVFWWWSNYTPPHIICHTCDRHLSELLHCTTINLQLICADLLCNVKILE